MNIGLTQTDTESIIDYTHLEHKELKAHIDRVGIVIYEKKRRELD